jgi:hypothetical protein
LGAVVMNALLCLKGASLAPQIGSGLNRSRARHAKARTTALVTHDLSTDFPL